MRVRRWLLILITIIAVLALLAVVCCFKCAKGLDCVCAIICNKFKEICSIICRE